MYVWATQLDQACPYLAIEVNFPLLFLLRKYPQPMLNLNLSYNIAYFVLRLFYFLLVNIVFLEELLESVVFRIYRSSMIHNVRPSEYLSIHP